MGNLQYKPNGERCIIQRTEMKETTESGIIIPSIALDKKLNQGTIKAVGAQCEDHLKEGQKVVFSPFAGQDIKMNGQDYVVVPQEDIIVYKEAE